MLGAATWNRVKIRSVGWPAPFGLPLKTSTQPLTVVGPRSAWAVPAPTFVVPQAAIACFIVMLPEIARLVAPRHPGWVELAVVVEEELSVVREPALCRIARVRVVPWVWTISAPGL